MADDPHADHDAPSLDYQEPHDIDRIHATITREKSEPRDGLEPISLWVVTLCGLALFVGGAYLTRYSGGFSWDVYSEYAGSLSGPPGAVRAVDDGGEARELTLFEMGERVYRGCVACHGANGMGQPGVFPPLVGTDWVTGNNARLIRILLHGMTGPVEVSGNIYNGAMPAGGGASLSDERIAAVLTFIRQSWGNDAPDITPEMVEIVRAETAGRTTPWTAPELLEITEEVVVETVETVEEVQEVEAVEEVPDDASGETDSTAGETSSA